MTILNAAREAASMGHLNKSINRSRAKTILRLPDLEQSKYAVLNSLAATSSQESYGHAIDEFIGWYCSEPRLAFNRSVVLRYRFLLEQKNLAPSTINVRLAAVRRLAHEAADTGLRPRMFSWADVRLRLPSKWPSGDSSCKDLPTFAID